MQKIVLGIVAFILVIMTTLSCLKNTDNTTCQSQTVESELPVMTKFATDNNITTTKDESGLLYQIITPGTGATPTLSSNVVAKYVGKFMNGTQFDAGNNVSFSLSKVIKGWQIGIPKIKAGGRIQLIIPSSLAYDCNPYYVQMQNKPLYFDVELISVQ